MRHQDRELVTTDAERAVGVTRDIGDQSAHLLQRLVAAQRLAGVVTNARCYDIGVPEGYHDAVARWPARVS